MAAFTGTQESALLRTEPPYPTHEFLKDSREHWVRWGPTSIRRLFWSLDGPLETAIAVLDRAREEYPETCEPFFNMTTGEYHPVAALPVSEPRVSSITVHVYNLEEWEDMWEQFHWKHSEPDAFFEGCEWGTMDEEGRDPDEPEVRPLRCCGMPRPRNKNVSIVVQPSKTDGPDGGFVTVLDYVTAVHPWLMGLRGDVLGELGMLAGLDDPLPGDTPLVVCGHTCDSVAIEPRDEWLQGRSAVLVGHLRAYGGHPGSG